MTDDAVDTFLTRLAEDERLQSELPPSLSPEEAAAFAGPHGFRFTSDEFAARVAPLRDGEWTTAAASNESTEQMDVFYTFLEEAVMSKAAMGAFFKKVAEDKALQQKLVAFAAQEGFEFSLDELSDADLDAVAGGYDPRLDKIVGEVKIEGKIEGLKL